MQSACTDISAQFPNPHCPDTHHKFLVLSLKFNKPWTGRSAMGVNRRNCVSGCPRREKVKRFVF